MAGDAKIWSPAETEEDLRKSCPTNVVFLRTMATLDFYPRYQKRFIEAAGEIERLQNDIEKLGGAK